MIRNPRLVRSFHTSRLLYFQRKSDSKHKMTTPRKSGGEFRNFRKAASYGNHHKTAPSVPIDDDGLQLITSDQLQDLSSFNKRMVTFPDHVQASLVHLASYQPSQHFELFRTHSTLIRDSTLKIAQILRNAETEGSSRSRFLIDGAPGIGKSTALSQAQSLAALRGWFVAHIPRATELIDGTTQLEPDLSQTMFARRWHRRLLKANRSLAQNPEIYKALKGNKPRELFETLQNLEIPILLTVDDFNAWAAHPYSRYKDASNKHIYHGRLEIPKFVLEILGGSFPLKKGAAFAAVSSVLDSKSLTIDVALGRKTQAHAYMPVAVFDRELSSHLESVEALTIERFSLEESATYYDYLSRAQVRQSTFDKDLFESHILSGNGNPRGLLQACFSFSY